MGNTLYLSLRIIFTRLEKKCAFFVVFVAYCFFLGRFFHTEIGTISYIFLAQLMETRVNEPLDDWALVPRMISPKKIGMFAHRTRQNSAWFSLHYRNYCFGPPRFIFIFTFTFLLKTVALLEAFCARLCHRCHALIWYLPLSDIFNKFRENEIRLNFSFPLNVIVVSRAVGMYSRFT